MSQAMRPALKKAQSVRYSTNFDEELTRLLGAYAYYLTNRQLQRAFTNMHSAILHVSNDLIPDRIFPTFVKPDAAKVKDESRLLQTSKEEKVLDGKFRKEMFAKYSLLFNSHFGTGPSLDGLFSYLDLRPRERPRPADDVVWISKPIRFVDVWAQYDYDYLVKKIGFVYIDRVTQPNGFQIEVERPMFSFNDKNILKKKTIAVPYAFWEQEARLVSNEVLRDCKKLELLMAFHLHMEGYNYVDAGTPAGASGVEDQGDVETVTDSMGFDYSEANGDSDDVDNDDVDD